MSRLRNLLQEARHTLGRTEVSGNAADIGILNELTKVVKRRRYSCFCTAIDDHACAFRGERGGDGETMPAVEPETTAVYL